MNVKNIYNKVIILSNNILKLAILIGNGVIQIERF
jgi:hypothetical protein